MQPHIRNPIQRLDPAGDLGRQPIGSRQFDFVFARAAIADDDEVDLALAAPLELGADGAEGLGVGGKDREAALDGVADAFDGLGR